MTDPSANPHGGGLASPPSTTAGSLLRAAREAGDLSIDAVAQQLKLAPRQVSAIEEDDYSQLPGRTFVRGFVRNYARMVGLDPEAVLAALAAGGTAPALAAPTLQPTVHTMGELPASGHAGRAIGRWAIPLTLAGIVAIAALYEWLRPAGDAKPAAPKSPTTTAEQRAAPAPSPPTAGTPLPNPLASAPSAPAPATSVTPPVAAPAAEVTATTSPAVSIATAPSQPAAATGAPGVAGGAPGPPDAQLVLAFRDFSWTEVKDRDGRVLLSRMNTRGTTQAVVGAPPLAIVIGNASDVSITYKGQPVDLAPYTRQNVARFTLP